MSDVRIPEVKNVPVNEIQVDSTNPNKMTPEQLDALKKNILKYGFLTPIVTNKDMLIADGEHRYTAALSLGMKKVPTIVLPLKEVDRKILRQVMNKLKGEHDPELDRAEYLEILNAGGFSDFKELLAMSDKEEAHFLASSGRDAEDDFVPGMKPRYNVRGGDVFQIGDHRVMCGDSTKMEDVQLLMQGDRADMVFTNPPYGVSYTRLNNPNGKDWGDIENDGLRGAELQTFLAGAFKNMERFTKDNVALYSCYASKNHIEFEHALTSTGWTVKQVLIWDKGHVLGHSDYHWCHEPILYCVKTGQTRSWYSDRAEKTILNNTEKDYSTMEKAELVELFLKIKEHSDLIRIRKDAAQSYVHPTQKPIELPKRMIINSSKHQDIILDLFGGSGSTLMACENTKRKARVMELDPVYCSFILERIEKARDEKAILLSKSGDDGEDGRSGRRQFLTGRLPLRKNRLEKNNR